MDCNRHYEMKWTEQSRSGKLCIRLYVFNVWRIFAWREPDGVHTILRLDVDKTVAFQQPDGVHTALRFFNVEKPSISANRMVFNPHYAMTSTEQSGSESFWRAYDSSPRRWQDRRVAATRWCAYETKFWCPINRSVAKWRRQNRGVSKARWRAYSTTLQRLKNLCVAATEWRANDTTQWCR